MTDTRTLAKLRSKRTRASTRVRGTIDHMIKDPAPFLYPDGLPSWWPFWEEVLRDNVKECVRYARIVQAAEGKEQP